MPRPRPQLPPSITGPVTTPEARALGLKPWQLRAAGLAPVYRNVWVPAGREQTLEGRARAALHVLPKGSVIGHLTAARLCDLPLPDPEPDEPVHVLVPRPARPRIDGVQVHLVRGSPARRLINGSLPVSPAARIWVDLVGTLSRDPLVTLGDAIMYQGWASHAAMAEELAAEFRRADSAEAERIFRLLEPRCASPKESELRLLLIDNGLTGFVVNVPVNDEAGGWICEPDFAWTDVRVGIQYQGDHHRTNARQWHRDIGGEDLLRDMGWILIRLVKYDLLPHRRTVTVHKVRTVLESRGWMPPPPLG